MNAHDEIFNLGINVIDNIDKAIELVDSLISDLELSDEVKIKKILIRNRLVAGLEACNSITDIALALPDCDIRDNDNFKLELQE